jgi:glycosyltransferase involved in cell wall biosynthesis
MPTTDITDRDAPAVWALAHVPPPVNGMTLLNAEVLRALQRAGPVKFRNFSPNTRKINLRARVWKTFRSMAAIGSLIRNGRVHNARLYLAANSRAGLIGTAVTIWIAKKLGYRVYLHHHTYTYIDKYDARMAWIDRWMGEDGVHIVHCDKMADDFRRQYHSKCNFKIVHPSVVATEVARARTAPHAPLRLGMLSNLMISKGVDVAIQTFESLHHRRRKVSLKLAGPIFREPAERCIASALESYPGAVEHVGPVYGDEKARFFQDIDVFLFPTRGESWGIVIHEALAAGVPVVTIDCGCTQFVVGDQAGVAVPRDADFISTAAAQIERWIDDPEKFAAASRAAIKQAEILQEQGRRQLDDFATHMFSPIRQESRPDCTGSGINRQAQADPFLRPS